MALRTRPRDALGDALSHPQQSDQVIGDRGISTRHRERRRQPDRTRGGVQQARRLALDQRKPAATGHQRLLYRAKIVFGMRIGQTEGDIGVAAAIDVRHSVTIAQDAHIVAFTERPRCDRIERGDAERSQPNHRHQRQHQQDHTAPCHDTPQHPSHHPTPTERGGREKDARRTHCRSPFCPPSYRVE